MRRILALIAAVIVMSLSFSGAANADTGTVTGTGDISKLVASNKSDAVIIKVFGPGGKCDVRFVAATLKGTNGATYQTSGGCYSGRWILGLSKGTKLVTCGGDRLSYNTTGRFWRFSVPRTCLGRLTDKIKVSAELTFQRHAGSSRSDGMDSPGLISRAAKPASRPGQTVAVPALSE